MKLPVFFSLFILFIIFYNIRLRKADKKIQKENEDFLEKERKAMFVRRKPLDDLNYIKISPDGLPKLKEDDINSTYEKQAYQYQQEAFDYFNKPMLNLDGINNTDLKLQYGPANLNTLIEYEQNFHRLQETLFKWGNSLYKANRFDEAILVLEKAISIESDLSKIYILLAELYTKTNNKDKLLDLNKITEKKARNNMIFRKVQTHIHNLLEEN